MKDRKSEVRPRSRHTTPVLVTADLLKWLYVGRMVVVSGILLAALVEAGLQETRLATWMFVLALLATGGAFWHSHIQRAGSSAGFLTSQVLFDVLLVTGVVHLTGGGDSQFAWLYILVISEGALLLPLPGGMLIGPLAAVLYFADLVWGYSESLTGGLLLQIGLFSSVAVVTGIVGDRLRRTGTALGVAQSELQRLRMDTANILETISTGIVTVEAPGRLLYMNPAAENLLGMEGHPWRGTAASKVLGVASPGLLALLQNALDEGVALRRSEVAALRKDERITLGVSTTIRAEPGNATVVTAIFQDITDLEKLAVLNRRNERLKAVAELSAAMAHEIKNPLASIRSAVEQLSRPSLGQKDGATLRRMIVRESDRLSRLLSDFIYFSRVRIGQLDSVSLDGLLADCVAVVERHPEAEERGIHIEVAADCAGVRIPADGDLLHRAMFNLILNAVQFSPDGGIVSVSVEDLRELRAPGVDVVNPIHIRIRDAGPGVPEDQAARIFDPFFTTRRGGSGLGLSVVHRAVEAHRGLILVDRWAEGAEFNLYLPGEELTAKVGAHD